MTLPRRPARHRLTLAAALVLATGSLVGLATAPSTAAASSTLSRGEVRVTTLAGLDDGSGPCTPDSAHDERADVVLTDGTRTTEVSDGSTYRSDADETDTVRTLGKSSATSTSSISGDVRRVSLTADLSATNLAAKGSGTACDVEVDTGARLTFELEVVRPGFITLAGTVARYGVVSIDMYNDTTNHFLTVDRTAGSTSSRLYAPVGSYRISINLSVARDRDVAGATRLPSTVSGRMSASLQFNPGGTATAPARGSGLREVSIPGTMSCGSHAVGITLRSAATRASSIVMRVNGRVSRTVTQPRSGQVVTLRYLPSTARVTVQVSVATPDGTRLASRTYEACRGSGF